MITDITNGYHFTFPLLNGSGISNIVWYLVLQVLLIYVTNTDLSAVPNTIYNCLQYHNRYCILPSHRH